MKVWTKSYYCAEVDKVTLRLFSTDLETATIAVLEEDVYVMRSKLIPMLPNFD
jgi:hypothetical protein